MKTIDYYFWMNSDWAYLGADRLEALAARQQAVIRYLPVDLPDVYSRTGGVLLGQRSPERQAYRVAELARWCRKLGVHVNPQPAHMCPDAGLASRIVIAADLADTPVPALYKAILKAQWVDEQDISDPAVLRGVLERLGLPADRLLTAAQAPAIDAAYRRNTDDAVKAGVFGSPSYVFRGEVFWGQDRLDMLEETLAPSPLTSSPAGRSTSTGA